MLLLRSFPLIFFRIFTPLALLIALNGLSSMSVLAGFEDTAKILTVRSSMHSDSRIIFRDTTWSYRDLLNHAQKNHTFLNKLKVKPNSMIAILDHNSTDSLLVHVTARTRGNPLLPFNPEVSLEDMTKQMNFITTQTGESIDIFL